MTADLYNNKNEKVGTIGLPERIFARRWNADLVHQALLAQLANSRHPVAHVKGRSEVHGGGRKPWRQKGTGRARHGSIRSPLWRHGGVTHGPTAEREHAVKLNKKMRQSAVFTVLSRRLRDNSIKFIDSFKLLEPKTKNLAAVLEVLVGAERLSALIIPASGVGIYRASRNLKQVKSLDPRALNVYDLLKYKRVLIEREAVPLMEAHYKGIQKHAAE
jgi:large subunit ribosomal protein L4